MTASGTRFTSPVVDNDIHIPRKKLLAFLKLHNVKYKRSIFIKGYPGQGKSILASQYTGSIPVKSAWYQLAEEDRDPYILASGIAHALKISFGESVTPAMDSITASRDSSTPSPAFLADALISDIRKNVKCDSFYIVLDDIHNIDSSEISLGFLSSLIGKVIPFLNFILISRPSEIISEVVNQSRRHPLIIDNAMLALSPEETAALVSLIRPDTISPEMIDRIRKKADGWAMGTVMLGSTYSDSSARFSPDMGIILDPSVPSTVHDYFVCEIFPDYPEGFLSDLEKLSLLSEISLDLALRLVPEQTVTVLRQSRNHPALFIRSFGSSGNEIEFHHLFRDTLRKKAFEDLDHDTRQAVLFTASDWYLGLNQYDRALFYRLETDDFNGAARIMALGAHFFFWERYAVYLRNIFGKLPEEMVVSHSWLCYFQGAILMEVESKRAMKYLNIAWRLFKKEENHHGEMLCLAKFAFFNASAGGRYRYGAIVLRRLKDIWERFGHAVSPPVQVLTLNSISIGHTYFLAEYTEAYRYSAMAASILKKAGLHSLYYSTRLTFYAAHAFAANWTDYVAEIEQIIDVFRRPDMSPYTKMVFGIGILNYLKLVGDFDNFDPAADFFEEVFTRTLPRGKIPLLGFVDNWRIESAIAGGNFCRAREVLKQAFAAPYANISIHTYGQLVHNRVFVAALNGEPVENIDVYAEEALRLRKKAGGPYFIWLCNLMIGAAYANRESYEKALHHLDFVVDETEKAGSSLIGVAGYANRAWVGIKTGRHEQARKDLEKTIRLMKYQDLMHFYTWTPHMMADLFTEAMKLGIETAFVRQAAAEKTGLGFNSDGKPLPMLRIQIFGGFTVFFRGIPVLGVEDIPSKSLGFFIALVSSRNSGLSCERMGDLLGQWNRDDMGLNAQQVMANRLRKRLKTAIPEIDPRDYLRIERQYHRLLNVSVDIAEFRSLAEKAHKLLDNARPWHASTYYRRAFRLWNGAPFGGLPPNPVLESVPLDIWKDIELAAYGWSLSLRTVSSAIMPSDLYLLKEVLWAIVHNGFHDYQFSRCSDTAVNLHYLFTMAGLRHDASDMMKIIYPDE